MGAPQIIVLCLWITTLAVHAARDGEPNLRSDGTPRRYSFWQTLFGVCLFAGLLYWGGFWTAGP